MPTFNQLVSNGRKVSNKKSLSPALQKSMNTLKKRTTTVACPQKKRCLHSS